MIKCYLASSRLAAPAGLAEAMQSGDVVWIDVLNATSDELTEVEKATGLILPSLVSLSEIEHSSRMRREGEAIILSLPLPRRSTQGPRLLPVGFVLTSELLLTVRFDAEAIFDDFVETFAKGVPADTSAPSIMAGIFEAIVDAMADRLEEAGAKLDVMAGEVLGRDGSTVSPGSVRSRDIPLRQLLQEIGKTGQMLGKLRATLLTGGRILHYVEAEGAAWFTDGVRARISTVKADIVSLDEYETHLSDKVQFLLDATLGLINMQQNDLFKVLTIVSVIGIPPTLVASIYGMNFHDMPELSWTYGYPYGLVMIALSAAIPLIWFKVKGWF
jgi:magnesium transporter